MELPRRFNHPYRTLRNGGMDRDGALAKIRKAGASFLESIEAVKDVDGLSLADSKSAVHESTAWASGFNDRESFWDESIAAREAEADSSPDPGREAGG